jgi:hypothetical protein
MERASKSFVNTMMTVHGVKDRYRGHVESIVRHPGNAGREEVVLLALTKTTPEWFQLETTRGKII